PQNPIPNPQVALANLDGAINSVPAFVTASGPVREARFIRNPDGSPDGSVHDLYTITGRTDAVGCTLAQPDFVQQLAKDNVVFRSPPPLFGLGLVENTSAATLRVNLAATQTARSRLGIGGSFNTNGNDNTITRFGWKAQNKSLLIFAGEAYNVEQGVTNELFPNKRETEPSCLYTGLPEDATKLMPEVTSGSSASDYSSDVVNFAAFIRFLAPPTPVAVADTTSAGRGKRVFANIGCHFCHVMSQTTGQSGYPGQSNVKFFPFSD